MRRIFKEIERGAVSIEARRYNEMPPSTDYSKRHAPDTSGAKGARVARCVTGR
jgi:hypothetical protein